MKSLHAEVASYGDAASSITALACVDRASGLVLDAYAAPDVRASRLVHAAVEIPGSPGLVVIASADERMGPSLERILADIARRFRPATAG